jgi:signal transduction protein with GAF and PtsI domain
MHAEQVQGKTYIEWVHEVGSHIAAGDTLDEALAATVSFAVALVSCDLCFIYVRDGAELVLWVWKHLDQGEVEHTRLPVGGGYTASLARHRVPVAISTNNREQAEARIFDQWSADPGETFVSVPLLARKELVGVMNLQHRQPRRYSLREVKLLSTVGCLLGIDVGISRLESQNSDLVLELETRKLVERGKGILQRKHGLSEEQAYLTLQRYSQQKQKSMKEIAQAIIFGEEFKHGALNDPTPRLRRSSPADTAMREIIENSGPIAGE